MTQCRLPCLVPAIFGAACCPSGWAGPPLRPAIRHKLPASPASRLPPLLRPALPRAQAGELNVVEVLAESDEVLPQLAQRLSALPRPQLATSSAEQRQRPQEQEGQPVGQQRQRQATEPPREGREAGALAGLAGPSPRLEQPPAPAQQDQQLQQEQGAAALSQQQAALLQLAAAGLLPELLGAAGGGSPSQLPGLQLPQCAPPLAPPAGCCAAGPQQQGAAAAAALAANRAAALAAAGGGVQVVPALGAAAEAGDAALLPQSGAEQQP